MIVAEIQVYSDALKRRKKGLELIHAMSTA